MKTRLGISVGILGAAIYFVSLFGGYIPLIILVGYVLLFESNEWLKKNAVKAFVLTVVMSVLPTLVNLLPDFIAVIGNVFGLFEEHFSIEFVNRAEILIINVITLSEKILFLVLGFKALNQGSIKINALDKLIEKHMQ